VELDWRGFELHPDTPPGGMDLREKFGPRIDAMQAHLQQFAASMGVHEMRMSSRSPNTRKALAVAEYAREQGKLERYRVLAMEAHWKHGKNLESEVDLKAVAAESGLDPGAAWAAARSPDCLGRLDALRAEAGRMGVSGIPTFFFGEVKVVGCQPYEQLRQVAEYAGAKRKGKA
jgi:predicted DsbA family dithiol-disulfide isomerase